MKKWLTVLGGLLVALSLFVTSGNSVKAATNDCGCVVSSVTGAEKNKMVADLISSQEFKDAKHSLKNEGYLWKGVNKFEVIVNHSEGDAIMIGVPFYTQEGSIEMAVFINGHFAGHNPLNEE